jgi:hypothetical protein
MKAFTVVYNRNRYPVTPINGHSPKFRVNVDGKDVIFEHDLDGHVRAEATHTASISLLNAIADRIEENEAQ